MNSHDAILLVAGVGPEIEFQHGLHLQRHFGAVGVQHSLPMTHNQIGPEDR